MSARRQKVIGNGSVYEVKDGVFQYRFNMGKDPKTGKYAYSPKRTLHCEGMNKRTQQAMLRKALEEYKEELNSGVVRRGGERSVSEYANDFHALREGTMGSPLAYEREGYDVRHIEELFGDIRLTDLRSDDIRHAYAEARKSGRFSESEIRRIHVKLKQVMQEAVDNELVDRNPCTGIKLPKANIEARQALTTEEAARLLQCLLDEGLCPGTVCTLLLLECGLRKGEALGLSWEDYDTTDPERPVLHIVHQYTNDKVLRPPKSRMSRRTIAVNGTLCDCLDKWKGLQRDELERYGLPQEESTPIVHGISVVNDADGKHATVTRVEGHNFSRWFRDFCVDNGFGEYEIVTKTFVRNGKTHRRGRHYRGLVPHALRHTQATLLISAGSDIKTVQARLGHASPSTTLGIYAHASEANDRRAADVFDKIVSTQ